MYLYVTKECQRQVLVLTPILFNEIVMGIGYGWIAPTLRLLQDHPTDSLSTSNEQASWIGSLHELCRLFGPLVSTPLLHLIGRKGALTSTAVAFFISFALISFTESVAMIYLARVIFGFAAGVNDVAAGIYLCENFKPTYRGVFGCISIACFYGGSLIEFCLGNYLAYYTIAYTNMVVAFVALFAIFASTESAHYLITKGRYERALNNFLWLRGMDVATADVMDEFEKLKRHIDSEREEKGSLSDIFGTAIYRKTIILVLAFCLLTNATGFDPITSYVSIAFTEDLLTPSEYTMLFGALQFVAAVLGTFVIEKMNRRAILMSTLLISASVHAATAILFGLQQNRVFVPYFSWWIFATITLYSMAFSFAVLPVFATIKGELLPQNVRSLGSAIGVMGHSFVGFFTAKVFLLVAEVVGVCWNFAFYSLMCLASVAFVYFVLPETRGKSLMEIQKAIETVK